MKNLKSFLVSLVCVCLLFTLVSCCAKSVAGKTFFGNFDGPFSMEFGKDDKCVYTTDDEKMEFTYREKGGDVFVDFGDGEERFEYNPKTEVLTFNTREGKIEIYAK